MKDIQIYGRPPKKHRNEDKKQPRRYDTADLIFLLGTLMAVLFLYRMTGGISSDAELLKTEQEQIAVAVMSTNAAESGGEREILREVTGEPFGYMTGEWNLWEYIGDLMASLLMGG
ncbi:MAG: hypothetical protein IJ325_07710 [Clostridia bacterium]|nr:hypothetical protein [Clostridia bacterium]